MIFLLSTGFAMEISEELFRQEERLLLLGEEFVIVATRTKKRVGEAPAIVTVITAQEIKNMGARNLTDVLKTVPGFGTQISQGHARSEIEVRGIGTRNSEKVLVLIDGHKINNPFFGGATRITTDMPVDNIKRIEIVRGPGSAIYGANAFMAVINIITKKAEDVDGTQFTVAGGSFDSYRVNLLFGKQPTDKLNVSGSVDYFNTNGANLRVKRDTLFVNPFQPDISMAPGRTDRWVERYGVDLCLSYADVYVRGNFVDIEHGALIGARNALSDDTEIEIRQFFTELGFEHSFSKDSDISAKIYYDQFDFDLFFELFPEGYQYKSFEFPDGLLTEIEAKDRTLGLNLQWDYMLFENNRLTMGGEFEYIEQFDVRTQANFNTDTPGEFLAGFDSPEFIDVSDTNSFNKNTDRQIWAVYVQDDWGISDYLSLILGIRFDHYSDFGEAISPRIGLTLQPVKDMNIKFLYGRAFRAPNFEELYNRHNVAVLGNPELDAETLDTYEVGLEYQLSRNYQLAVNYFHTEIDDLIILGPTASGTVAREFENIGQVDIDGVEFEFMARYSKDNYGYINLSLQDAEDEKTGDDLADVPKMRGNLGINFGLTRYLNVNTHLFYSGERSRVKSDSRDDLPAYALVDLTLILKEFFGTMEIRGSVFNLFDEDYVDPALPTLPDDEPQPGINYMLEISYKF
jgi:iron complex outermembrane receptor protein